MLKKEDLWALQRVLDIRKSSLSSTYEKNSEANNKVYDLNLRIVAALDRLAEVYETLEDTWDIVEKESAEGDMLHATEEDAIDKMEAARQHQDRTLEMPEDCRKSMDGLSGSSATTMLFMSQRGSMCSKRVGGTPNCKGKLRKPLENIPAERERERVPSSCHQRPCES